jgi:hypothetical protein
MIEGRAEKKKHICCHKNFVAATFPSSPFAYSAFASQTCMVTGILQQSVKDEAASSGFVLDRERRGWIFSVVAVGGFGTKIKTTSDGL